MENEPTSPPKEIVNKPELELVWRGLAISISEGQLSRKQAYEMIHEWEAQETNPTTNEDDII